MSSKLSRSMRLSDTAESAAKSLLIGKTSDVRVFEDTGDSGDLTKPICLFSMSVRLSVLVRPRNNEADVSRGHAKLIFKLAQMTHISYPPVRILPCGYIDGSHHRSA